MMDNGRIQKELKELADGVKNVSYDKLFIFNSTFLKWTILWEDNHDNILPMSSSLAILNKLHIYKFIQYFERFY